MRQAVLALALMMGLSSCITTGVQNRTLVPAIVNAWEGVRADAELGGMDVAELEAWDMGIESGDLVGFNVRTLEAAALTGVDVRLADGEIGPVGAEIMRDRARAFRRAVEELTRVEIVAATPRYRQPLVISRGSWANSPPPAIAERTYR